MTWHPHFVFSLSLLIIFTDNLHAQPQKKDADTYDFVPREDMIFEDDFSHDSVGKFPFHWRFANLDGNFGGQKSKRICSVKKDEAGYSLEIIPYGQPKLEPIITTGNHLSDSFTIEYDFLFESSDAVAQMYLFGGNQTSHKLAIGYLLGSGTFKWEGTGDPAYYLYITQYPSKFDASIWHHFAASFNKGELKYYIDRYLMGSVLSPSWPQLGFYLLPVGPVKLSNFRIAKGKETKQFNTLLTDKKVVTHAIHFDVNKSTIQPSSIGFLLQLAQFLKANPNIRFEIGGHTDSDGDATANVNLSKASADEVKKQLVSAGVQDSRLTTRGYGASKPVQANTTPDGKAENRRVEFVKQ